MCAGLLIWLKLPIFFFPSSSVSALSSLSFLVELNWITSTRGSTMPQQCHSLIAGLSGLGVFALVIGLTLLSFYLKIRHLEKHSKWATVCITMFQPSPPQPPWPPSLGRSSVLSSVLSLPSPPCPLPFPIYLWTQTDAVTETLLAPVKERPVYYQFPLVDSTCKLNENGDLECESLNLCFLSLTFSSHTHLTMKPDHQWVIWLVILRNCASDSVSLTLGPK